ncbi:MAG: TolC family protein [Proteobacteria bacterium]|nr:TolC family protein [Pseudomonadota bacterium]
MKSVLISLLMLLGTSPLSADYDSMREAFKAYSPPPGFTTLSASDIPGKEQDHGSVDTVNPDFSHLSALKATFEETLSDTSTRFAGTGVDKKIVLRMAGIASDPDAAKKQIHQAVVLDEIRILAALRHPAVLAARKKVLAELQLFDQVMGLDDTLRQYSAFTKAIDNKAGPLNSKDSIKMTYPSPGLTALKGRIVQNQVALEMEKMKIVEKQVVTDIERAYWDLVYIGISTQVTQETLAALNRLKDVATILYKSGKTSFQDVIKITIKMEELKEDLITLVSRKKNIEIRLLELLNLPADTRVGRAVVVRLPSQIPLPEKLYPVARKHRQELKVIAYQIQKLEAMVEMAESMVEAPFTLGLSSFDNEMANTTGSDAPKEAFAATTMAAMKNNSPIKPWYGTDEPWLNQTRQNLSALRQTLVSQENATDRMVRNAWFDADKTQREYLLYKDKILPLSKSALDVSTKEYEAGSIPFSEAIDSYTYWLKVKLTIAGKQTGLGTFWAELENIVGKPL